jgi:ribonuclease VapC
MIIDASAIVAILKGEPEEAHFVQMIEAAAVCRMSPVNWFEAALHAEKAEPPAIQALEDFAARANIIIVPIDEVQARLAHQAWRKFGKGRHPAKLNLGDCFAYALAKATNEPLLYKGGDFPHTDIVSAV